MMLTVRDAKVIAARFLVEKYGIEFVRNNIDKRLFTGSMDLGDAYQIDFELFENGIDEIEVVTQNGFENNESIFPDIILSILVNKQSGDARVLN